MWTQAPQAGAIFAWSEIPMRKIQSHIVRIFFKEDRRLLFSLSALVGGTFLVQCDALARIILSDRELPVGVLTALIGSPMLIYLILRRNR